MRTHRGSEATGSTRGSVTIGTAEANRTFQPPPEMEELLLEAAREKIEGGSQQTLGSSAIEGIEVSLDEWDSPILKTLLTGTAPLTAAELKIFQKLIRTAGISESAETKQLSSRLYRLMHHILAKLGPEQLAELMSVPPEPVAADDTSRVREELARGLVFKGVALGTLGRSEDAVAVFDELVRGFGEDDTPEVRKYVARGLVGKGVALGSLGHGEDAVAVFDELVRRFSKDPSSKVGEQVARGLICKGVALGSIGRKEDELAVYDDLVRLYGKDRSPKMRSLVAKGLEAISVLRSK